MNIFSFIGLMKMIYGRKLPELDKIEKKGLLAVKIAQHYALRIDFLNDKVCAHLTKLYRAVSSIPQEETNALIEKYTDRKWLENFNVFDIKPFASASIGQVHRATLKNGTEVVVKIIKGDYKERFLKDIRRLRSIVKWSIFFYPKLARVFNPEGILDNIEEYTLEELNLINEEKGCEILKKIYLDNREMYSLEKLAFPEYFKEISNENILVSRYIKGKTFDELLEMGKLSYELLLEFFHLHGFYLFGPGVFHGDIHPGNIILGDDGKIYFVDTGAVSRVDDKIRVGLFNFFDALSLYDFKKAAFYLNEMAEISIRGEEFSNFEKKFLEIYKDFADSTVSQVSLTKKMMETIKTGVLYGMEFDKGMFAIIKSMMYLDGMVLRCNPNAKLLKDMRGFIDEFRKISSSFT